MTTLPTVEERIKEIEARADNVWPADVHWLISNLKASREALQWVADCEDCCRTCQATLRRNLRAALAEPPQVDEMEKVARECLKTVTCDKCNGHGELLASGPLTAEGRAWAEKVAADLDAPTPPTNSPQKDGSNSSNQSQSLESLTRPGTRPGGAVAGRPASVTTSNVGDSGTAGSQGDPLASAAVSDQSPSRDCEHGSLRRSCAVCERDEEIAELRRERDELIDIAARDAGDAAHYCSENEALRQQLAEVQQLTEAQRIAFEDMRENYANDVQVVGENLRQVSNAKIDAIAERDQLRGEVDRAEQETDAVKEYRDVLLADIRTLDAKLAKAEKVLSWYAQTGLHRAREAKEYFAQSAQSEDLSQHPCATGACGHDDSSWCDERAIAYAMERKAKGRAARAGEGDGPRKVVCLTCGDTHRMSLGDREVMCTRCPTPCHECKDGGTQPYCAYTPCKCECHWSAGRATDAGEGEK